MILSAQRLRSIGWLALLAVCGAAVMVLSFRVNALRSQVHRAEGQIVALKQQKMYLETEFETRANQQQLKAWNVLELGYVAPKAGQYLENERQLAALSKPADPGAPAPIRVASVDDTVIAPAAFPEAARRRELRSLVYSFVPLSHASTYSRSCTMLRPGSARSRLPCYLILRWR
jgi:hypothetical protein